MTPAEIELDAFDQYEAAAASTAVYRTKLTPEQHLTYATLGLSGESGEFADKVKKLYRDHDGQLTIELREALLLELGDVLWYVAMLSEELGSTLGDVARANIAKLRSRAERGALHGEGDQR